MKLADFFKQVETVIFSLPCCTTREKESYDLDAKLNQLAELDPFFEFIEFPEEMICPINKTIMRDPVRVPTSMAHIFIKCDRSAVLTWIAEYNESPFDRHTVTLQDVQEDREMRKNIWLWANTKVNYLLAEAKADAICNSKPESPGPLRPELAAPCL